MIVKYRVKELNNIYPVGWIYISNVVYDIKVAVALAILHENNTGLKTSIDIV